MSSTALPEMGFVDGLNEEERSEFGGYGEFLSLNDGEFLIQEGADQDSLFLIIFGKFHVQTEATGRSILLGNLKSGDTVGEINIFDSGKASASVVCKSLSQVWKIDKMRLEQYLAAHPEPASRVLVNIATQLSKRLRGTNEKVAMAREAMMDSF
ncbi:MAG: cyclic nucleotide-binding domain-containing protein [Verrucomicrobiales bacterium]|nr:cyclic nucleotide-binding domain-containing protein [Verrucomicrobiales bacterium]